MRNRDHSAIRWISVRALILGGLLVACGPVQSALAQGTCVDGGPCTPSSLNNVLYLDGVTYARNYTGLVSALNAAATNGAEVVIPTEFKSA